jgi:DNA mismatch endonuclease (patch repair protein)
MSGIRGKDTRPEMLVRRRIHGLGFRYRLHDKSLPGAPDLVFPKYRTVVFIHGCFWHRHEHCRYATIPESNQEFWLDKFQSNLDRYRDVVHTLETSGWRVVLIWECGIRKSADLDRAIDWLSSTLKHRGFGVRLIWP